MKMIRMVLGCVCAGCCALVFSDVAPAAEPAGGVFGTPVPVAGCGDVAMALCLEGDVLYAGCERNLVVLDAKDPLHPRKLGSVGGFGSIRQIASQRGFVYVSTRESGFWIVDATDPRRPRIRSRFDCCELATGVDVAGNVAFLGQRQNGVEFIDVSDPDHPAHIAMRKTDESQSVKYRDGYVYSGDWGSGRLTVFDARDMRNIRQVAYVPLWGYGDGVWLKGKYLYAATGHHAKNRDYATLTYKPVVTPDILTYGKADKGSGCGHGLDIFDVSDPADPKRVGRVDYPPFYARGLDMWTPRTSGRGDMVFAAQTHNGLFAVDCSDPAKPKTVDRWTFPLKDHPEWPSCCIGSVAVGDGCVYVAGRGCGVLAIPARGAAKETFVQGEPPAHADYREPYANDDAAFWCWKSERPGQARAVALRGDVVYAACGDAGLHVLKIRPEGGFEKIGELKGRAAVFDVQVEGSRLYAAEGLDGWGVYEIEGEAGLREVARRKWLDDRRDPALCVWKPRPGWTVLSTRRGGVSVFRDADVPAGPCALRVPGSPGWDKYLMDGVLGDGRWVGFNFANTALCWIDLAAQPGPALTRGSPKNRINLSNGLCAFPDGRCLAMRGSGYFFLEPGVLDPPDGSVWPTRKLPGAQMNGIPRASAGRRVVLTNRIRREIGLWDFGRADQPAFLGHWKVSGNPDLAVFHNEKFIVPCGHQGVIMQK